ncbi:hypothetical protein [Pseudomonas sp. S2_H01]
MTDTKDKIINGMCQTWRHDFGLEKRTHAFGTSGMTDDEREFLTREMAQLYEHHVAPVIAELENARKIGEEFASLAERRRGFEEAYKTVCLVRNRLISENHALQKDAQSGRLLKLISGGRANQVTDQVITLMAENRRLKLLVGEPVPPTWEEFVGPHPETVSARLRRKLSEIKGGRP